MVGRDFADTLYIVAQRVRVHKSAKSKCSHGISDICQV